MSSNVPALTRAPREPGTFRYAIVEGPVLKSRQLFRAAASTLRMMLPVPDGEVPARVRVLIAVLIAALPWVILSIWAPSGWAGDVALLVFTILIGATYSGHAVSFAWPHIQSANAQRQPGVVLVQVLSATSYVEGWFALLYYIVSTDPTTQAFDIQLSRIDAAYFTIGTATTTGTADIHPVEGFARLVVCVQMVLSLFLLVTAAGIALQALLAPKFLQATTSDADRTDGSRADEDVGPAGLPAGPAALAAVNAEGDCAARQPIFPPRGSVPG
jgi:hypothetical protein